MQAFPPRLAARTESQPRLRLRANIAADPCITDHLEKLASWGRRRAEPLLDEVLENETRLNRLCHAA